MKKTALLGLISAGLCLLSPLAPPAQAGPTFPQGPIQLRAATQNPNNWLAWWQEHLLEMLDAAAAQQAAAGALKKGVAYIGSGSQVAALKAKWYYSYSLNRPADVPAGVDYVPLWFEYYNNNGGATQPMLATDVAHDNAQYLLGFNEPDHTDQANMTVAEALDGWQYTQNLGVPLGSPACATATDAWMQQFMQGIAQRNYRVDFICVHWYGESAQSFLNFLATVHGLYHRPIWVTEFAYGTFTPGDTSGTAPNAPAALAFMKSVVPAIKNLSYVQRFAWFVTGTGDPSLGASALFNNDGSLTPLGTQYAAY